jgi:hypothetical protein
MNKILYVPVKIESVGQPDEYWLKPIMIPDPDETFEALKAVNNYFVNLQNKCALTNSDERAWKLVAKLILKLTV